MICTRYDVYVLSYVRTWKCTYIYFNIYIRIQNVKSRHKSSIVTAMGLLRLAGSIKLQVTFAQYHLFCRALLQKRPIILNRLLNRRHPI